jgi:hypothetical protein
MNSRYCLQEEQDEHGQGKWEGKQETRMNSSSKKINKLYILMQD